jgi:hypothetical protein
LCAPHRRLIKDAKCASKEHYFLFNDILAITTEQRGFLPFLTKTEYKYEEKRNAFTIHSTFEFDLVSTNKVTVLKSQIQSSYDRAIDQH